jgi:hypothetical protein
MLKNIIIVMLMVIAVAPLAAQDKEEKGQFGLKVGFYNDPDVAIAFGASYLQWLGADYGFGVDIEFSNYDSETEELLGMDEPLFSYLSVPAHINIIGRTAMDGDLTLSFGAGVTAAYRSATERLIWIPEDEWEKSGFSFGMNAALGLQFSRFFLEGRYIYYLFETLNENDMPDMQLTMMAGFRF